jgi:type IV pilus assembly protein PilQ
MRSLIPIALAAALLVAPLHGATMKQQSPDASQKWTGEKISIKLAGADIKDVLHTFSQLTGISMAIDPDVKGSVTIELHDVPWDQALDLILRQHKLAAKIEDGGVMRVLPR